MKKYEINVHGTGAEIVVGNLTKEQLETIYKVMENKGMTTFVEFYDDDELVEELGLEPWSEAGDLHHGYGPLYGEARLEVIDLETGDVIIDTPFKDLDIDNDDMPYHEAYHDVKDNPIIFCESIDKGTPYGGELEIEGGFDINKLVYGIVEIMVNEDSTYELIASLSYDGTDIDNETMSTQGKSFEITILT